MDFDRVRITNAGNIGPTVGRLITRSAMNRIDVCRAAGISDQSLREWVDGRGMQTYNLVRVLDVLGYDLVIEKREGKP